MDRVKAATAPGMSSGWIASLVFQWLSSSAVLPKYSNTWRFRSSISPAGVVVTTRPGHLCAALGNSTDLATGNCTLRRERSQDSVAREIKTIPIQSFAYKVDAIDAQSCREQNVNLPQSSAT